MVWGCLFGRMVLSIGCRLLESNHSRTNYQTYVGVLGESSCPLVLGRSFALQTVSISYLYRYSIYIVDWLTIVGTVLWLAVPAISPPPTPHSIPPPQLEFADTKMSNKRKATKTQWDSSDQDRGQYEDRRFTITLTCKIWRYHDDRKAFLCHWNFLHSLFSLFMVTERAVML